MKCCTEAAPRVIAGRVVGGACGVTVPAPWGGSEHVTILQSVTLIKRYTKRSQLVEQSKVNDQLCNGVGR